MISLVICSKIGELSTEIKENIDKSIGFEYELIVVDNSQGEYSIFSAYNEGVQRSTGDILCFIHEDILFKSANWGQDVEILFKDDTIGLVGVTGSHFLPNAPLYWVESPFITSTNMDVIDGKTYYNPQTDFLNENGCADAVVCDGQFLAIRKSLFEKIRFDDIRFSGFHMYDMDICMQVLQHGYRVVVTNKIFIEHHSLGSFNESFENALRIFYEKWQDKLPIDRGISMIPRSVISKVNDLYRGNYIQDQEYYRIIHSKNYRTGYYLLRPLRWILSIMKHD